MADNHHELLVSYMAQVTYLIPRHIFNMLLPIEQTNNLSNEIGNWWIKWNVLYYIDKDLIIKEHMLDSITADVDYKTPESMEFN